MLWEESTKTLAATLLPSKSLKDFTYAVDWAVTVLDHDWGLAGEELTLKGDGEPALRTLCKALAEARKGRTPLEVSPPGDHQANGSAEQAVRTARAQARTHLAALASALGLGDLPLDHPVLPWAVRHGAWCFSRFHVGKDGKTGWERNRGKPYRGVLAQLGEQVLYLRPKHLSLPSLHGRFAKGTFLGRVDRTNEVLIGVGDRLLRTTRFARLPRDQQWSAEALEGLRGLLPWKPGRQAEGEEPVTLPAPLPAADAGPANTDTETAEKRLYLTKKLLERFGRTPGCPGCGAPPGKPRAHTEACRTRLTDAWEKSAKERVAELEKELGVPASAAGSDEMEMEMEAEEEGQEEQEKAEAEEEKENGATTPLEPAPTTPREARKAPTGRKRPRAPREATPRDEEEGRGGSSSSSSRPSGSGGAGVGASSSSGDLTRLLLGELDDAGAAAGDATSRGEKRDAPEPPTPGSWLQAAEARATGTPSKTKRVGALLAFTAVAREPTCTDTGEAAVLDQYSQHSLSKPVFDAASGVKLDPAMVKAARKEELDQVHKHKVYRKVLRQMARDRGKRVIGVKWVDLNKGDDSRPNYRSRLVAKELRAFTPFTPQEELHAATPPTASQNLLLSMLCTRLSRRGKRFKLCFLDVRRAFFYADATEEVFVELPEEEKEPGKDLVGLLEKSMYGTRSASRNWQRQLGKDLAALGFEQARGSPCLYYHPQEDARLVIHGDDLWLLADQPGLDALLPRLHSTYELKEQGTLGPEPGDAKAVSSLNRLIRYEDGVGAELEADPRHAELIIAELGLETAKAVTTPGTKEADGAPGEEEPLDDAAEVTAFRGICARALYLSVDRPEIRFAVKELARRMAAPTRRDLRGLKRLGRYLRGNPRVVLRFPLQGEVAGERNPDCLYCPVDSNWADCRETRRSTSGGALVHGKHTLATWSVTQAIQALSSGEAEYYALLRGAVEALGLAATAEELGFTFRWVPRLGSDSDAARGAAGRHGLGKLKHLELKFLWLQATLRQGRLVLVRQPGEENFADLLTKHLTEEKLRQHLERGGLELREGRADGATQLAEGAARRRVAVVLAEALRGLDGQLPGVHRWVAPDR